MKPQPSPPDAHQETAASFFRQSGWMMAANMLCGVFMAAAQFTLPGLTPSTDFPVFATILRIFMVVSLPASAIQVLLAQQAAAAVTDQRRRDLSATARGVLKLTLGFWIFLLIIAAVFQTQIAALLQASNPNLVWGMMTLIFGSLALPIFLGLLQGMQMFMPFGWAMIINGVGRFVAILAGIKLLKIGAIGASVGAFAGFAVATLVACWPARSVFRVKPGRFDAPNFFRKVALLTAGAGSTIFIIQLDMVFIQAHFPNEISKFYTPAATIGVALVTLCVPVAAVMFPKIVRSRATATTSDALRLAVTSTTAIAGLAALVCTIAPELPLRILYMRHPEFLKSAPLIPWMMWAMVPIAIYNVLVNNLIAREKYAIIPFSALLPLGYALTLFLYLKQTHQPPFVAFRHVIQILMLFNTALMVAGLYFTRRALDAENGEARSQPANAKP